MCWLFVESRKAWDHCLKFVRLVSLNKVGIDLGFGMVEPYYFELEFLE
jgi:hypothetical protein